MPSREKLIPVSAPAGRNCQKGSGFFSYDIVESCNVQQRKRKPTPSAYSANNGDVHSRVPAENNSLFRYPRDGTAAEVLAGKLRQL